MKAIISPAKKMKTEEVIDFESTPVFIDRSKLLMKYIKSLSYKEAKSLWACNDRIASLNFVRFQSMELENNLSPALLSYEGLQYQYMAPGIFTNDEFEWVSNNLRILSGLYGILKPFDGITPYRLEMQANVKLQKYDSLYGFWGDLLYKELVKDDNVILNLASNEYSKCIKKYLKSEDLFIDFVFAEEVSGKLKQKGTLAKMARGKMVRYLASINAVKPEEAQGFIELGFKFDKDKSNEKKYVFIKQ